jgi:hypothetical protein
MPQGLFRGLPAQEHKARKPSGATVEIIGYEDGTVLKLLSLQTAERVRLVFNPYDTRSRHELRAFMQQDPSRPSQLLFIPTLAGTPSTSAEARWIK